LNQLAIGSPCVFPTSPTYPYCTQARVPGATSTPHSLMSDLGRHLRGLAVTPPRKKRVRFTVQRQRIIEGGGVRKPRLPTILLMWTKNTDASQPASWKNLSRCPRPGIFSSPAAGASPSFPPNSLPGSWCRHPNPTANTEYAQSAHTSCHSSSRVLLGVPSVETLELRDQVWMVLSARPWNQEAVDDVMTMVC